MSEFSINEVSVFDRKIVYYDFGDVSRSNNIYIQGQLHSNEVNSFLTLNCLREKMLNKPPNIAVRIVPCCNPFGWENYLNGNDGRASMSNKKDWNRLFHHAPIKDATCEGELAYTLWNLSSGFNKVIDVHTPDFGFPHVYTNDIRERLLTFDDLPYVINDDLTHGSFQQLIREIRKIESYTIEIPSCRVFTRADQEYWSNRILSEINNMENKKSPIRGLPRYFGRMVPLYASISGIPLLLVEPNTVIKGKSEIVQVISFDGESEVLFSENDCIPLCFRRRGLIKAGYMVTNILSLGDS